MRLFSYCVRVDDGAAPNPFWGVCTLTICKPVIRRTAKRGDWIVGIGSKDVRGKDYSGKLVYAMQVTDVKSLREYDRYCRKFVPEKIPNVKSNDYRRVVGDCIYDYAPGKNGKQRAGVHKPINRKKDVRGKNALLSSFFYYFGHNAVDVPDEFSILIRQGQGHQSFKNEAIKLAFIDWITNSFEANKLYGKPQVRVTRTKLLEAAAIRCDDAVEDETCGPDC